MNKGRIFPKRGHWQPNGPFLTITPKGAICVNIAGLACLGEAEHVRVFWNQPTRRLSLQPAAPEDTRMPRLYRTPRNNRAIVSVRGGLRQAGLLPSSSQSFAASWNEKKQWLEADLSDFEAEDKKALHDAVPSV